MHGTMKIKFILRIKEQETSLNLHEHDDDMVIIKTAHLNQHVKDEKMVKRAVTYTQTGLYTSHETTSKLRMLMDWFLLRENRHIHMGCHLYGHI